MLYLEFLYPHFFFQERIHIAARSESGDILVIHLLEKDRFPPVTSSHPKFPPYPAVFSDHVQWSRSNNPELFKLSVANYKIFMVPSAIDASFRANLRALRDEIDIFAGILRVILIIIDD